MILSPNNDAKYFSPSCPRLCDQELIVVIVYYFQSESKKNTLVVELLTVTRVPYTLSHPICRKYK